MRLPLTALLFLATPLIATDGLYPPGLLPLITRANTLLSQGQFHDAAKSYTEAIDQSPADYLLYYKRATAYFSLSRHSAALDDFDKVLALTHNSFEHALLMKAKILTKDGRFTDAREAALSYSSLSSPSSSSSGKQEAHDLLLSITAAEQSATRASAARTAQLWTACTEAASHALRIASHAVGIRALRVECALAGGDVEGAVGDLTRLSHLSQPTSETYMRTFSLSYFFLPSSTTSTGTNTPLSSLKQCLHYDPDSRACLAAHRLVKALDRGAAKLERMMGEGQWGGVVRVLLGSGYGASGKEKEEGLWYKFEEARKVYTAPSALLSSAHGDKAALPLPDAEKTSPRRAKLVRALCVAYTNLAGGGGAKDKAEMEKWCGMLLDMCSFVAAHGHNDDGGGGEEWREMEVDALLGKAEAALGREEWEEAVRLLERAGERSGRRRDIQQKLQKAQKVLKQSKSKDYYKVLGVPRDVDAKGVKRAFRTAARTAHPDKGGSEAKMAAVNEAYEVLSNPELRQRFDNGDDPNDPMAGQGSGGFGGDHPFAHFFQQAHSGHGGQGGFQFHYRSGH